METTLEQHTVSTSRQAETALQWFRKGVVCPAGTNAGFGSGSGIAQAEAGPASSSECRNRAKGRIPPWRHGQPCWGERGGFSTHSITGGRC